MADIDLAALLHFHRGHGALATITVVRLDLRFGVVRQRHEAALAALFGEMLELCADAGLVGVVVLATDGTKVHTNASQYETSTTTRSPGRSG